MNTTKNHAKCPFCGCHDVAYDRFSWAFSCPPVEFDYFIYCEECNCHGPSAHTEEEAWALWEGRDNEPVATETGDVFIGGTAGVVTR